MNRLKLFAVAVVLCSTGVIYAAGGDAKHNAPRVAKKAVASCCAGHKAARQEVKGQASKDSCCKSGGSCCKAGASCCANHKAVDESNEAASCPADGSGKDCCAGGSSCCDGGSCCAKRAA